MDNKLDNAALEKDTPPQASASDFSFSVSNQALSKALKILSGVVDHSQVIQILGYIKCDLQDNKLSLIASNSEIEIHIAIDVLDVSCQEARSFTLPCRKLFDITRTLESDAILTIKSCASWSEVCVAKHVLNLPHCHQIAFPSWLISRPKKRFACHRMIFYDCSIVQVLPWRVRMFASFSMACYLA